ncbi:hypothetical protein ACXHXM_32535
MLAERVMRDERIDGTRFEIADEQGKSSRPCLSGRSSGSTRCAEHLSRP